MGYLMSGCQELNEQSRHIITLIAVINIFRCSRLTSFGTDSDHIREL
jgi:hypothetical protein